ncbi:MAG: hypothetical protein ACT452_13330 [Microthrixaceae bacterium]
MTPPAPRIAPRDAAHLRDWFDLLVDDPSNKEARSVVIDLMSTAPTRWLRRVDRHMRERSIYYRGATGQALEVGAVEELAGTGPDQWDLLGAMSMVRSGHVREAAVERLADGPTERTLRYLLLRADDWVEPVQRRAMAAVLVALTDAPPAAVLEALPAVWERLTPGRQRGRAADFASAIETWLTDPAQRETVLMAASSGDRWIRRLAVRTLFEVEEPLAVLTNARLDDDVMVASQAADAYLGSPSPDRSVVRSLLNSPFASIRESAAYWLLHKDPGGPNEDLVQRVMTDRSRSVRFQAQVLLRSSGVDAADWYRSRDPLLDPTVLRGLADVGTDADEDLALAAIASQVAAVRSAGVRLLALSGTPTATNALVAAVGSAAPGLGGPAAIALRKRGLSPQQVRHLTDQAEAGDPIVGRNVRRALMGLPRWPRFVAALRMAVLESDAGYEGKRLLDVVIRQWERAATNPTAAELAEANALLDASKKPADATWRSAAGIVDRAGPTA